MAWTLAAGTPCRELCSVSNCRRWHRTWRTLCSTSPVLKLLKLAAGLCDPEGVGRGVRQHVEHIEGDGHSKRVGLLQARTGVVSSHHCPVMKLLLPPTPLTCFVNFQEADLQRYRTHLISMGKIENAAGANLKPRRHKTFEESIKAFEVGHINLLYQTLAYTKLQICSSFAYCHMLLLQSSCTPPC